MLQIYSLLIKSVSVRKIKLWRDWISDKGEIQPINHELIYLFTLEKSWSGESLLKEYRDSAATLLTE